MAEHRLMPLALVLAALACLAAGGCRRPDPEGHQRAAAKTTLLKVCKLVYLGQSATAEPTPTTLPSLIAWLEEHASKDEAFIDYRSRTIKDPWGRDIVVIARDGAFVGVGSPGPDGAWEGGAGDDLVVTLEEVKRKGGLPKARLPTGRQTSLDLIRLTWTNYTGMEDPKQAKFMLNGVSTGLGQLGFRNALKTMPGGSTIIVYPFYPLSLMVEPSGPNRKVPFDLDALSTWGTAHPASTIVLSLREMPKKGLALVLRDGEWIAYERKGGLP